MERMNTAECNKQ